MDSTTRAMGEIVIIFMVGIMVITTYINKKDDMVDYLKTDDIVETTEDVYVKYKGKETKPVNAFKDKEVYVVDYEYDGVEYNKEVERKEYRDLEEGDTLKANVKEYKDHEGETIKVEISFGK